MNTKRNILSLGLAAALVATLALPAPKAHAGGNDAGYIIAGALIGGALAYIITDSDDSRCHDRVQVRVAPPAPVVVYQSPVCRPQPVYVPQPVIYRPQPVIVPRQVVYRPQPRCPVPPHHYQPTYRHGNDHDRRPPAATPGHRGDQHRPTDNGNRGHGRR